MNETGSFVVIWMNLESVTQHKVSQKKKNKYCILTHAHVFIYIDIYIMKSRNVIQMNLFAAQE